MYSRREIFSPMYKRAAQTAIAVQVPIAIICFLTLDGGVIARICAYAIIAFWFLAIVIAFRRPWSPSALDLWYWRWGILPCLACAFIFAVLKVNFYSD